MLATAKRLLRTRFPLVVIFYRRATGLFRRLRYGHGSVQVFDAIMRENRWKDSESVSGEGSNLRQTEEIRREIPLLLRDIGARSLLDAPCGDFNWMRAVDLGDIKYFGVDVVPSLIEACQRRHGAQNRDFVICDIITGQLPRADVILSRDCLVHLSYDHIFAALHNFRLSGARWLLTTTFPNHQNWDIATGDWRPLNLEAAPFRFPPPERSINERLTEYDREYADKSLALWRVDVLPILST